MGAIGGLVLVSKLCYKPSTIDSNKISFSGQWCQTLSKVLHILIVLAVFWSSIQMVHFFLDSSLVKCGLIYNLIPLCLKKGRSWVGTNWLLVTTAELTGGLYMIWIMALWIIFELLLSAEYFLLYIFCSMAMELFVKVKVFWFEWILIYFTMGFE